MPETIGQSSYVRVDSTLSEDVWINKVAEILGEPVNTYSLDDNSIDTHGLTAYFASFIINSGGTEKNMCISRVLERTDSWFWVHIYRSDFEGDTQIVSDRVSVDNVKVIEIDRQTQELRFFKRSEDIDPNPAMTVGLQL